MARVEAAGLAQPWNDAIATSRWMDIEILAHRGHWNATRPANSAAAVRCALKDGVGVETDVRDVNGELVIAHDPPLQGPHYLLNELLATYAQLPASPMLALDIKSDGLAESIRNAFTRHNVTEYFVFDMSIPDALHYRKLGLPFFTRQSEFETVPAFYDQSAGVWLDAFESDWYDGQTIQRHLDHGESVAVVSPELHGRPYEYVWQLVRQARPVATSRLFLCTDYPNRFGKTHANSCCNI